MQKITPFTMTQRMLATPVTAISLSAARLSIAGAVAFWVLVLALHFIKADLDPSWRFISEYAIGTSGWVMVLAFLAMAVSCAALFVAIRSQVAGIAGRIGMVLLLVVSVALIAAGIFTMGPVTAPTQRGLVFGAKAGDSGVSPELDLPGGDVRLHRRDAPEGRRLRSRRHGRVVQPIAGALLRRVAGCGLVVRDQGARAIDLDGGRREPRLAKNGSATCRSDASRFDYRRRL